MSQDNEKLKERIVNSPFFFVTLFFAYMPISVSKISVAGKLVVFFITLAIMIFVALQHRKLVLELYKKDDK